MPSLRSKLAFVALWSLLTPFTLYRAATDVLAPAFDVCAAYDWHNETDAPDYIAEPAGYTACIVDVATGGGQY